jgi:hypothetical protein
MSTKPPSVAYQNATGPSHKANRRTAGTTTRSQFRSPAPRGDTKAHTVAHKRAGNNMGKETSDAHPATTPLAYQRA